jgi:hypothetical protein
MSARPQAFGIAPPRWVQRCDLYPARCAILPQLGGSHPAGYIDTGVDRHTGERVYISIIALDHMAVQCGYRRGPTVLPPTVRELEQMRAELAGAREDVATLQARLDAIHTLKLGGAVEAAKPGRPRKAAS